MEQVDDGHNGKRVAETCELDRIDEPTQLPQRRDDVLVLLSDIRDRGKPCIDCRGVVLV
jgi:hypothetical protein